MIKRRYDRLDRAMVRDGTSLREATMEEAIARAAEGFGRHKGDSFGMFSCSKATNEMNYLAQKFSRVVMGSNNVDSCNRT